jgi:hypothetical protein
MSRRAPTPLVVAVRVFPDLKDEERDFDKPKREWHRPDAMLVFDAETRTDRTQRLTFGSYRFIVGGQLWRESLFYGDDLAIRDRRILERQVATPSAVTSDEENHDVSLLTRHQFVEKLFKNAYKGRCLLIAFNFGFDASRVACDFAKARRRFAGGFSLDLWSYQKDGTEHKDQFRPSICIKHIDSKRALKGFTGRSTPDKADLIPEGSTTGEPEEGYIFRGHFLDLRTLAFALTDKSYTLEKACDDFGVEHGKQHVTRHGIVTPKYIKYNRRDVIATSELAVKLLEEYDKHDIKLQETKAYSPASIGKAYLRRMRIKPILQRQHNFPIEFLGHAQSAFFGGRTGANIRKVPVPVVYTDFLSMYPTVNSLMDLWRFVTARKITIVEHCQHEVEVFLQQLSANLVDLFTPETWKNLTTFVQVIPDGDILPSRGRYNLESNDWQVAVNHIYADHNDSNQALWFSLPDVVASVLLTGRIPKIVDAFRIEARGKLKTLESCKLRSVVDVDPRTQDFFRVVIEERQRLKKRGDDISPTEKKRLDKALKVLANATSYGIYAEMHRQESERKQTVTCHGIDAEPFRCRVAHPDVPGEYCFPPLASLITGAARLMLALLEYSVTKLGGTYAMEDTDSMAIVATEHGGMIPCPGGKNGTVKALSWKQVDDISKQFDALNPYDRHAVSTSILKLEDDNYDDPETREHQRQLYCLAISAKRHALFLRDNRGSPVLLRKDINNKEDRWSEHGLGHLLNPTDPESEDREWIAHAWLGMIRKALGLSTENQNFGLQPAIGRTSITSPAVMRPLSKLNEGKKYVDKIKPFNFLVTCHVKPFGHPPGVDAERFHLIAPYEADSREWLKKTWTDQYSGNDYKITTTGPHGDRRTARVKTYGEVLREYEIHPESKCADATGKPCRKQTVGLLQRRHVRIDQIKYIGKESNSLEEVEAGLEHSAENVYTEYVDRRRDEWHTKVLPALGKIPPAILEKMSGLSPRMLRDTLAGRSRPYKKNQERLAQIVRKLRMI